MASRARAPKRSASFVSWRSIAIFAFGARRHDEERARFEVWQHLGVRHVPREEHGFWIPSSCAERRRDKAQLTERPFSAPPPPARSAPLDRLVLMSPRYSGDNRRVKDGYRPTRRVGPGDGPAQETTERGSAKAARGVSSDADRPAWLVVSAGASGGARPSQVPPSHSAARIARIASGSSTVAISCAANPAPHSVNSLHRITVPSLLRAPVSAVKGGVAG
jgi:hypothetical protein